MVEKRKTGITRRRRRHRMRTRRRQMAVSSTIKKGGGLETGSDTVSGKYCAPGNASPYTCYTRSQLRHIATVLNRVSSGTKIDLAVSKRSLWRAIDLQMRHACNTEYCWLSKIESRDENKKEGGGRRNAFRPSRPSSWRSKPMEWLSNIDILNVMEQYETVYPDFLFVGPVPMDFATKLDNKSGRCVSHELCDVSLKTWHDSGVRRVGIVFNLDPHHMSGSHWVALFINISLGKIFYYDSYGMKESPEVTHLMNILKYQGTSHKLAESGQPYEIHANQRRHQFKNSECGVYACHFLSSMLENDSDFDTFTQNGLNDTHR